MAKRQDNAGLTHFKATRSKGHTRMEIPESFALYVCPAACGRRYALDALKRGGRDKLAFLTMDESEVVSGGYLDGILAGVDQVLERLERLGSLPRLFALYFHCIDDLLGTDGDSLLTELSRRRPDIRFTICRVDPIARDESLDTVSSKIAQYYSFLAYTGRKDDGVNLVGAFAPFDPACELCSLVLAGWGIRRQRLMVGLERYEDYQAMADSSLNLATRATSAKACREMEKALDIPWFQLDTVYEPAEIQRVYEQMARTLGRELPDLAPQREAALAKARAALELVGDTPIVVDNYASLVPFSMARALLQLGFHVAAVFGKEKARFDQEAYDWLRRERPDVPVYSLESTKIFQGFGLPRECVAIGFDCAYALRAAHFVDMLHDEGYFGYHGLGKLMDAIAQACTRPMEWEREDREGTLWEN